jgi:two-component system sensor histidine kinase UhpB
MHTKPIKVLLIEDNLAHARAIGEGLCANLHDRFDLMCAERMSAGLEILGRGGIDLMLLDLNLPDSTGLATFDKFHRAAPHVPVVIMTGVDDPTLGQHAVAAGARDVLVKGQIEPSLLARVIQHTVEKQRLEAASRAGSRGYGSVFDHSIEAMLLVDDQARCLAANTAASSLLGRSLQQLKSKRLAEVFIAPEDWPRRWERWRQDGLGDGTLQYVKADGEIGDIEFSVTPDCIASCHLVILRDVTSRRRAEETLRGSCEQWRSLATRYQSSHAELERTHAQSRQEMAARIQELMGLLSRAPDASATLRDELRSGLEKIALLANVGTSSGAAARKAPPRLPRLGPVEALRSQAREFQQRTGIQCTLFSQLREKAGDNTPATRLCPILEQALSNVAIHASATAVQVRVLNEAGKIVMEIEDNGTNITETHLSDPRTFRLTGVREQILRFGGDFILEGTPGKGTTLRLWIPASEKARPRKAP